MIRAFGSILVVALAMRSCGEPVPTPIVPSDDAGVDSGSDAGADVDSARPEPVWNSKDVCSSAYSRAQWLGCDVNTPESGTWIDACKLYRSNGMLWIDIPCTRAAKFSSSLKACGFACK